jgi:hypothetical protein
MSKRPPQRSDEPPEPATFEVTAGGSWPGRPGGALLDPKPLVGLISAGYWYPIADYHPDMGRVLVWLSWFVKPQYQDGYMDGTAIFAARFTLSTSGPSAERPRVWMGLDRPGDGLPLEMHGKTITHFCPVRGPQ